MRIATLPAQGTETGTPTQLARILREHFVDADWSTVAALEAGAEYLILAPGETLFHQGETRDDIYFVLSGRLRATTGAGDGNSHVLGEITRGETIGELALFTGEPRSATITALRDTTLARVDRALLERAMAGEPALAFRLARLVIDRFRQAARKRAAPAVPVTICILPVSPDVDAVAFARTLEAHQPQSFGRIAVLDAAHIAQRFGADTRGTLWQRDGAIARYLDESERSHAAVYLAASPDDCAWTRFCLQHADEVILLADADADPALSLVETQLLVGPSPISIARQTLVLLHGAATRTPEGTSRWLAPRNAARHFHLRRSLDADMARMARIVSGRAIGLVLAGGGARGFAHLGVYQTLEDAGIPVDFIGGTSIGALMGALMALDVRATAVTDVVRDAFLRHPKGNITGDISLLPLISLIKGERSRESLSTSIRRFTGRDIDLEDTWKTFFVMASNFTSGTEATLTHGPLVPSVTASYAIPGALPPVLMDGQLMYDGGTFNNFPVDVMARMGAGKIIGVDLSGDGGRRVETDTIPGAWALLLDRLRPRKTQRYRRLPTIPETMVTSSFVTSLARQREQRQQADLLFRPDLPNMRLLDWNRFEETVAAGRAHAAAILGGMSGEALAEFR